MEKSALRKEVLKRIRNFSGKEEASRRIVEELLSRDDYRNAEAILAFCPLKSEPDISPLLEDERVLLPFIEDGEMKFGRGDVEKSGLGVKLVRNGKEIEYGKALIIVPLVAFDSAGHRLGRGGGYYDRYLFSHKKKLHSIAVAFSCSLVDSVPTDEWDEMPDEIIVR